MALDSPLLPDETLNFSRNSLNSQRKANSCQASTVLSTVFILLHLLFQILSLQTDWSNTLVDASAAHLNKKIVLYPATFKTNYENFRDAGAMGIATIMLIGGIGQPLIKQVTYPALCFRDAMWCRHLFSLLWRFSRSLCSVFSICCKRKKPLGDENENDGESDRENDLDGDNTFTSTSTSVSTSAAPATTPESTLTAQLRSEHRNIVSARTSTTAADDESRPPPGRLHFFSIALHETTSKLTMATSYVGVIMLSVTTINFTLPLNRGIANVETDTLMGTQWFMFAGYASIFSLLAIRKRDGYYYSDSYTDGSFGEDNSEEVNLLPAKLRKTHKLVAKSPKKDALLWVIFFFLVASFVGTISLPLATFHYSGLEQSLMEIDSQQITIWSLPSKLFSATSSPSIAILDSSLFYINAMLIPFISSLVVWKLLTKSKCKGKGSPSYRNWLNILRILHPFSFLVPLAAAVAFSIPSMHLISTFVFDDSIEFCDLVYSESGDECMIIDGEINIGCFCLVGYAVMQEFLIVTVLYVR